MLTVKNKKSKPSGSTMFWYFYEKAKSALSKKSLAAMNIPHMYKQIRTTELKMHIVFLEHHVLIRNERIPFSEISTKYFYSKIREIFLTNNCAMKYWTDHLNIQQVDFSKFHKLSNSKFVFGSVKNLHYSIVHRFLHTRSRQSHMFVDSDAFCKHCRSNGLLHQENIMHCIVDCPRIGNFWHEFKKLASRLDNNITMQRVDKIFGMLHPIKEIEVVFNLLLQIGQKSIWQTRWKLEQKDKNVDTWSNFRKQLLFTLYNLQKILNAETFDRHFIKHRIVKLSRYKPTLDF
jgi:hypothetical protein